MTRGAAVASAAVRGGAGVPGVVWEQVHVYGYVHHQYTPPTYTYSLRPISLKISVITGVIDLETDNWPRD